MCSSDLVVRFHRAGRAPHARSFRWFPGGRSSYGTGALGGAVNVRLPQARFEPGVKFHASAGYDSASRGLRGAGVGHFSQGDHALMLGASLARNKDYKEPRGRVAHTGYDSGAFIGQYRYRLDGAQQLRVSVQQHRDDDVWYPLRDRKSVV